MFSKPLLGFFEATVRLFHLVVHLFELALGLGHFHFGAVHLTPPLLILRLVLGVLISLSDQHPLCCEVTSS
jgi:hypothetical protein